MSNKITLNIGFGNAVEKKDIKAIVQPNSAPIKRFIKQKQDQGLVIDATMGKKLRAVIALGSGYVVLSAISVSSLISRIEDE
jgi:regulator of extracellular matrix RemA (YlzA/DUF370 family)